MSTRHQRNYAKRQANITRRKKEWNNAHRAAEHARRTSSKRTSWTMFDESQTRENTDQSFMEMIRDEFKSMIDADVPTSGQIKEAFTAINPKFKISDDIFGDKEKYDEFANDETYVNRTLVRLVLNTIHKVDIENAKDAIRRANKKDPLISNYKKHIAEMDRLYLEGTKRIAPNVRIPTNINPVELYETFIRMYPAPPIAGGGQGSSVQAIHVPSSVTPINPSGFNTSGIIHNIPLVRPSNTVTSTVDLGVNPNNTTLRLQNSEIYKPRPISDPFNASEFLQQHQYPGSLVPVQGKTDIKHEQMIGKSEEAKFNFVRNELERLKKRLEVFSSERFQVLQYHSIHTMLEGTRIGVLHTVDKSPADEIRTHSRTPPTRIKSDMIELANYNEEYTGIKIYIQRSKPTRVEEAISLFTFTDSIKYIIDKVYVFYTHKNQQYYIEVTPANLDKDFMPIAFRFLFNVDQYPNIGGVISSLKNYVTVVPSFVGFWREDGRTDISRFQANSLTKQIILSIRDYSQLAFQMARLKYWDYQVSHLTGIINDESREVAIRTQANGIAKRVKDMSKELDVWSVDKMGELVDMATDLAILAGRLDSTIKNEEATTLKFVKEQAAKYGEALQNTLNSVSDVAALTGELAKGITQTARTWNRMFINEYTLTILVLFLCKTIRRRYSNDCQPQGNQIPSSGSLVGLKHACSDFFTVGLVPLTGALLQSVPASILFDTIQRRNIGLDPWIDTLLVSFVVSKFSDNAFNVTSVVKATGSAISSVSSSIYQSIPWCYYQCCSKTNSAKSNTSSSSSSSANDITSLVTLAALGNPATASSSAAPSTPRRTFGPRASGFGPAMTPNARAREAVARAQKLRESLGLGGGYTRKRKHNTKHTRRHRR